MTLDQKIEIVECHEAGMKVATIARERGMPDSSVRTIVKCKDQIKEIAARSSHLSLNTVVRKKLYSCNYSVLVMVWVPKNPKPDFFGI